MNLISKFGKVLVSSGESVLMQQYKKFVEDKIKATIMSLKMTTKKLHEYDPKVVDILNEEILLNFKEE